MHGAAHRPIPASAHGLAAGEGTRGSLAVHRRRSKVDWSASTACWAAARLEKGPRWASTRSPSGRTSRTTDNRGNGSSVRRTHGIRSGKRERRL